MQPRRPKALARGDRVAVISPSGPLRDRRSDLENGLSRLKSWGLRPVLGPHALDRHRYLAGTDRDRAADLQAAIDDPEVRGIFCVRGGFGATRILALVDFARLARDPKPLVGYSDVTALLAAAWRHAGLVSFHGPMVATTDDHALGTDCDELQRRLVMDGTTLVGLPAEPDEPSPHTLVEGIARGRLVGGNLSLVCALLGTPWAIDATDCLVFLEDVGEQPYRVDRMLTQLRLAGFFERAGGVLLGDFHFDEDPPRPRPVGDEHPEITRVLVDRLGDLPIPVVHRLPFGHRPRAWTLPFGGLAQVHAPDRRAVPSLRLVEPAVE